MQEEMTMVRIGIAGIGYIAEEYIKLFTHGRISGAVITALSSRNESHMRETAEKYGLDASLFTDYDAMLKSGCIDMVMICTPHPQRPWSGITMRPLWLSARRWLSFRMRVTPRFWIIRSGSARRSRSS